MDESRATRKDTINLGLTQSHTRTLRNKSVHEVTPVRGRFIQTGSEVGIGTTEDVVSVVGTIGLETNGGSFAPLQEATLVGEHGKGLCCIRYDYSLECVVLQKMESTCNVM